jgi:hypothetical protein
MFALWPGDRLNFSIFIKPTFGFVGQHAASEAGHIANTNVMANLLTKFLRGQIVVDDFVTAPWRARPFCDQKIILSRDSAIFFCGLTKDI